MKIKIAIAGFLLIFALAGFSSLMLKSVTPDEACHHIPSGYVFLTKGDLRFDTNAPPLTRYIMSLPLIFMHIDFPDDASFWRRDDRAEFGRDFYRMNIDRYPKILAFSRSMILLVCVIGGVFLYLWASRLYSQRAGIFALFLYCFSPNILAHAKLATTDAVTTVFVLLAAFMSWRFLQSINYSNALIAGIALGLALLSKYSALLILPVMLLFFFIKAGKRISRREVFMPSVLLVAAAFLTLWAGYGFEIQPLLAGTLRHHEKFLMLKSFSAKYLPFISDAGLSVLLYKVPLPLSSYLLGISGVVRHGIEGHRFFFLGNWYTHGLPCYYLTAFLIKTPLPVIIAFIAGLIIRSGQKLRPAEYYILSIMGIFFLTASFSGLQLGLRYILPIYPLCFIIASGFFDYALRRGFAYKLFTVILVLWYIVSSILIWPDYLSYFNEFIGGPNNGHKYLRGSNIDWGQDLPALSKYLSKHNIDEVSLRYFGEGLPGNYGIHSVSFSENEYKSPGKKVYAISVQYLDSINWTKNRTQDAKAGYSIFIYDLRKK